MMHSEDYHDIQSHRYADVYKIQQMILFYLCYTPLADLKLPTEMRNRDGIIISYEILGAEESKIGRKYATP